MLSNNVAVIGVHVYISMDCVQQADDASLIVPTYDNSVIQVKAHIQSTFGQWCPAGRLCNYEEDISKTQKHLLKLNEHMTWTFKNIRLQQYTNGL